MIFNDERNDRDQWAVLKILDLGCRAVHPGRPTSKDLDADADVNVDLLERPQNMYDKVHACLWMIWASRWQNDLAVYQAMLFLAPIAKCHRKGHLSLTVCAHVFCPFSLSWAHSPSVCLSGSQPASGCLSGCPAVRPYLSRF